MSESVPLSLSERLSLGFSRIEESSFLPSSIQLPYDQFIAAQTFDDLLPLFNAETVNQLTNLEKHVQKLNRKYEGYQSSLRKTRNVFSSDVDYI